MNAPLHIRRLLEFCSALLGSKSPPVLNCSQQSCFATP